MKKEEKLHVDDVIKDGENIMTCLAFLGQESSRLQLNVSKQLIELAMSGMQEELENLRKKKRK